MPTKTKKVISTKNLPRKMPLHLTLTLWLVVKVFNAPEWIWGALGLLLVIAWVGWVHTVVNDKEEEVDIFKDKA